MSGDNNTRKVCVYAICKNEEQFVERWMEAVHEADLVVVVDTGSTDGTVEKLRAHGALVYQEHIDPWRFDVARNLCMDHIPEDIELCVSNDLDEVFAPGWRDLLEKSWQPCHTRASYLFTWSYHSDGSRNKQFTMEKIHARHGFRWVHPVHEVLAYSGDLPDCSVFIPSLLLDHYPDLSKPRSQYLPLLELSSQENPQDDRTMFWLGREYMFYGMHQKCIDTLQQHLALPSAVWEEERCASMRFIAASYRSLGMSDLARSWLFRAIAQCPTVREPYLAMAKLLYDQANWPMVDLMVEQGLRITTHTGSYLMEPETFGYALYDYGAIANYHMGNVARSIDYAQKACEAAPQDKRLQENLAILTQKIKEG